MPGYPPIVYLPGYPPIVYLPGYPPIVIVCEWSAVTRTRKKTRIRYIKYEIYIFSLGKKKIVLFSKKSLVTDILFTDKLLFRLKIPVAL